MPIRDVFYYGEKPNVHPREQFAESLADAREKCSTEHFWVINEFCDYKNFDWDFDFEFLPDEDVWAENHNNVWPSQHQKDSGTWLCPKVHSDFVVYRNDVSPAHRKNEYSTNWRELDLIDHRKFDFSWHPDPSDPPYIYKWGCKFFPAVLKHVLEYHVPGATQEKYMSTVVELLPNTDYWIECQQIDKNKFDMSWRPNPLDPPFIYIWGNDYIDGKLKSTLEYHVPNATVKKYMPEKLAVLPEIDRWVEVQAVDRSSFDFSWRPDPREPAYIYTWGNKYIDGELKPTLEYHCENATERKYMTNDVCVLPEMSRWVEVQAVDRSSFDFSWRPDPREPAYIYVFGNTLFDAVKMPTVEYHCENATERKYMDNLVANLAPNPKLFEHLEDSYLLDYTWLPDPDSPPYIYAFGNQWNSPEDKISVQFVVPGATEYKFMTERAVRNPTLDNWIIPDDVDTTGFDFSWEPSPAAPPYIYEFGTQWQKTGGPRYVVPGATEKQYVDFQKVIRKPTKTENWYVPDNIDSSGFDFSWHPDDTSPPYTYVFATQWAFSGGPVYNVPNATEIKYVDDQVATAKKDMTNWVYDATEIDIETFDFSWHPYVEDQPYIYEFGTQHQKTGGPKYITPGADSSSPIKYIDTRIIKAMTKPRLDNWEIPDSVDVSKFDLSWVPHPDDPPYIYVFGNQWFEAERMPTAKYRVAGATEVKYVSAITATLKPNKENWVIAPNVVIRDFDFSWIPDPHSPPYIYVFGNQWYSAEEMSTLEYRVPGATEKKYVADIKAKLGKNMSNWKVPSGVNATNFDFSWVPHPKAPPYIYQFGTLQDPTDGPIYTTPNNQGEIVRVPRLETDEVLNEVEESTFEINRYYITTTLEDLANQHTDELFWVLTPDIDYSDFDFSWRPSIEQAEYVHAFGSAASEKTQTYFINGPQWAKGNRDINWVQNIELTEKALAEMFVKPDMFYVDKGNNESAVRFDALKAKYGNKIQKTRYLNSWVDTINRCANRATSSLIWVLNSELDYSDFTFDYYPNPWQMKMVHVFGTQWSHWGTTFLVNRETFSEDTKYIKVIEHLSNLNFVKTMRATATACVHDIVMIDHGNTEIDMVIAQIENQSKRKVSSTVKYSDSYLNTIKNYVSRLPDKKEHYIWLCSSVCDYSTFDFSYICDPFAKDNLHVFPSGKQKFGDTFLLDVNKTKEIINDIDALELYTKVNYNRTLTVDRLPAPQIVTTDDTLVDTVKTSLSPDFPYSIIMTEDNINLPENDYEPMNLWEPKTKNIISTSTGNSRIVVPREAAGYVNKELYEYPYIKRAAKLSLSKPIDIVFLSNGEVGADDNYKHLLEVTQNLPNRVVRVDGINGRVAAYHAAAEASTTPWMFTVFAKLKVSPKFDWNWQPDRMQSSKHYIFHAKNPVNGLTYGHQAMIAYNKKLTLANKGLGLDFTLDDEHEVVPLISGTAHYNTDEFSTWRTAFREVIKLMSDPSDIAKDRLDVWLNKATGEYAQYSIKGALDAEEYYTEVKGDFEKIKLSYEWEWLRQKFNEV